MIQLGIGNIVMVNIWDHAKIWLHLWSMEVTVEEVDVDHLAWLVAPLAI